ncbi:MAG: TGS domain-containing protein [Bacteroidia bacterium]|nr:TGS domain-containing protein [Bacteroidia bacterium]
MKNNTSLVSSGISRDDKVKLNDEYKALLKISKPLLKKGDTGRIRKAYELLLKYQSNKYLNNEQPTILFSIGVARISVQEIGLGTSTIICALLFIPVIEGQITIAQITDEFGLVEAEILDGLLKFQTVTNSKVILQADNFRKYLFSLAKDVRVILISLAIQMYKLRNTSLFEKEITLITCEEAKQIYIPLAHRLGFYNIKTELEDLILKYSQPDIYHSIFQKLSDTQEVRKEYVETFLLPLRNELDKRKVRYEIKWRTKSVYSIWSKMKKQNVEFEEVYDIFAIRIILTTNMENEKMECWKVYSVVTDIYPPNPSRLRDWISIPKSNGYESLHTTVMGPQGKWVEIQIRTQRMNDLAERGLAAHWKYKGIKETGDFDRQWLNNLRELLENSELNVVDFINYFSMDMASNEVFVFTPGGDLKKLPKGATALDFAFEIHTDVGAKCIGAKVNHKAVPLRYQLQNGDQVEILTSKNQKPAHDWLNIVVTTKARARIKKLIDEEKFKLAEAGKEIIHRKLKNWKLNVDESITKLLAHYKLKTSTELYYRIYDESIAVSEIKTILTIPEKQEITPLLPEQKHIEYSNNEDTNADYIHLGENIKNVNYSLAKCCSPIFGDDVFGFVRVGKGISIHRKNCPNALRMIEKYNYRIMKITWGTRPEKSAFQAIIKITGLDELGMINNISTVISQELKLNMRSFTLSSKKGVFEGIIKVFVNGQTQLQILLRKLIEVKGVTKAIRLES